MKLLIVLPSNLIGGAEVNAMKLAKAIISGGGDVDVVFLSKYSSSNRWDEVVGANRIYMDASKESVGVVKFLKWILLERLKTSYDVIFSTHVHCNALVGMLVRLRVLRARKVIARESTNVFSWFSGWKLLVMKAFYRMYLPSSKIVCQTEGMKDELIDHLTYYRKRNVTVITNPVDLDEVRAKSEGFIGSEIKAKEKEISIVSVGRLVAEKAYDVLIKAMLKLPSVYTLYIVGGGQMEVELKALTQNLNLDSRVHFLGHKDNPIPYMKASDVSVVSSRLEGFPNVLLEMMVVSERVVSTNCADGIDKIPGIFTCEIESPESLAEVIKESFSVKEENHNNRVKQMRDFVGHLDVDSYLEKLFEEDI